MHTRNRLNAAIAAHTVYRYVGPGFINGCPARDLTAADLAEVKRREGITREMIERSRIYERVRQEEIKPFCGTELGDGGRCRRRVNQWGERCWQHQEPDQESEEVDDGTEGVS